jgi:hypothetical protein
VSSGPHIIVIKSAPPGVFFVLIEDIHGIARTGRIVAGFGDFDALKAI